MYVYIQSESRLWTVGFYSPDGEWHSESDHDSTIAAANRVRYLHGGIPNHELDILTDAAALYVGLIR
jgi:hypothetical protein